VNSDLTTGAGSATTPLPARSDDAAAAQTRARWSIWRCRSAGPRRPLPGDLIVNAVTVCCALVLIVNDRVLKTSYPTMISGKLSDFFGLVMFPLVCVGAFELLRARGSSRWMVAASTMSWVVVVEGVAFSAIKLWTPAADVYRSVVSGGLWLMKVPFAVGEGWPALPRALHIQDPWDLMALVVLPIPVLVVWGRNGKARRISPPPG